MELYIILLVSYIQDDIHNSLEENYGVSRENPDSVVQML